MKMKDSLPHTYRLERGASLVEFTLIFPLLLLMLGAVVDLYGVLTGMYRINSIAHEAARDAKTNPNQAAIIATVKAKINAQFAGEKMYTFNPPVVAGPYDWPPDTSDQDIVRIELNGQYAYKFLRMIGFTSYHLTASATARYEGDRVAPSD